MKLPNNGGKRTHNGQFWSPNEVSGSVNKLHLIEWLVKDPHRNPQTPQSISMAVISSSQTIAKENTYTTH